MAQTGTRERILKEARGLLQRFGFNGFSFQHIADAVGVKKPSLYDHFESKEALGNALIAQYRAAFMTWAEKIQDSPPGDQLRAFFELLAGFCRHQYRICPIAMLTSDLQTLPPSMKHAIVEFHGVQKAWLTELIAAGKRSGDFKTRVPAESAADFVIALSMGAQQVARLRKDPQFLERDMVEQVLRILR